MKHHHCTNIGQRFKSAFPPFVHTSQSSVSPSGTFATVSIATHVLENCSFPLANINTTAHIDRRKKRMRRRKNKFKFDVRHQIDVVPVYQNQKHFKSPYQPLCHQYRGTSNSSVRVHIANHILLNECHLMKTGLVGNRALKYRDEKIKKMQRFHQLQLSDSPTYNAKQSTMFITDTVDPFFESRKPNLELHHNVQFLHPTSLTVFDSDDGCCHNLLTFPTFVKLPRNWSLQKKVT
jgi:hypothetical protein